MQTWLLTPKEPRWRAYREAVARCRKVLAAGAPAWSPLPYCTLSKHPHVLGEEMESMQGKLTPKMAQVASVENGNSRLSRTLCSGCSRVAASSRIDFTTVSFSRRNAHILHGAC